MVRSDDRLKGCLTLRGSTLQWGARTLIMGIVNVSPDSFSGDGLENEADAIVRATDQWEAGADIVDVGGESTRPGHRPIDEALEMVRVLPVVRAVRSQRPAAPISIDSYKPAIVRAAHAAGADLLNSVWGAPDELLDVVAELEMPIVAMHNQIGTSYDGSVVDVVLRYLENCAARASARAIPPERIILDPGIGFGKTAEHNIELLDALDRIVALGFPTMIGTSRKSTIGKLTGRAAANRVYGTAATTALAVRSGIDMVRVHDVAAARDTVAVADAIVRGWRPPDWTP